MAAVAALRLQRPVKLVLNRGEDMRMTGKRHSYSADFKIGLSNDGRILAYQVMFYQNAGAAADLSPAILERSLLHATNSYFIANVRATAASCRTNVAPNTAFRGFGAPQAMFVMESAIYQAAETMGMDPAVIKRQNLLQKADSLPYGMTIDGDRAIRCRRMEVVQPATAGSQRSGNLRIRTPPLDRDGKGSDPSTSRNRKRFFPIGGTCIRKMVG